MSTYDGLLRIKDINTNKPIKTSWIKTSGGQLSSPLTFSYVRKQILWGIRFITFEKKKLFFKEWINSGIFFVNDIIRYCQKKH